MHLPLLLRRQPYIRREPKWLLLAVQHILHGRPLFILWVSGRCQRYDRQTPATVAVYPIDHPHHDSGHRAVAAFLNRFGFNTSIPTLQSNLDPFLNPFEALIGRQVDLRITTCTARQSQTCASLNYTLIVQLATMSYLTLMASKYGHFS